MLSLDGLLSLEGLPSISVDEEYTSNICTVQLFLLLYKNERLLYSLYCKCSTRKLGSCLRMNTREKRRYTYDICK